MKGEGIADSGLRIADCFESGLRIRLPIRNPQSAIRNPQAKQLSVVIPTHDRTDLLRACLATVTRHAPADTEVIVVDDASPGGRASRAAAAFPRVQVVQLRRRSGFCAAVNAGIAAAQGEVVELLNDDTEVTPGWAEAGLAPFADPAVGAVAPLVLRMPEHPAEEPRIDSAGDRYFLGGVACKRGHGEFLSARYLAPCLVFGASASSGFYRRAALLEVGCFPESFGAYFEDVDVSFRLQWAGYRIRFEPGSRVFHHGSASHSIRSRRLQEQQSRNEERVFWRNVPAPALPQAILLHLAVLAGKAWLRWSEGNLLPFLCGRLRVLTEVRDLWRHRRALRQAWRVAGLRIERGISNP